MQQQFLLINLCDLSHLGTLGPLGSPLNLMLRPDLGDELLPGAYYRGDGLDENFVVVRTTPERAQALRDGLNVIGQRKLGCKVRTMVRQRLPSGDGWRYVPGR